MKHATKLWQTVFASGAMILLILDSKTALSGAGEGLKLCLQAVVPSLFPFFFLSMFITPMLCAARIKVLRPLGKLCRLPFGAEPLFLLGILGGYPVGAKAVDMAVSEGILDRKDGKRMLSFCSNAGPAFLFGITACLFEDSRIPWVLWGIQILSSLLTGMLLPAGPCRDCGPGHSRNMDMTEALYRSIRVMAGVCGWVILFRLLLSFLRRWIFWFLPETACFMLTGILELTNGCLDLSQLSHSGLRFLLCAMFLNFGGISVAMQTVSAVQHTPLSQYLPGKLIQSCSAFSLSLLLQPILFPASEQVPLFPGVLIPIFLGISAGILAIIRKNNSRNSLLHGV